MKNYLMSVQNPLRKMYSTMSQLSVLLLISNLEVSRYGWINEYEVGFYYGGGGDSAYLWYRIHC